MPTFNANVLPSSTGFDLGSAAQRWDAFLQQLDVSGIASLAGIYNIANIRIVDGTNFATIQAAIDDLPASGGTVYIPPGTYAENISSTTQGVHLIGAGVPGVFGGTNTTRITVISGIALDLGSAGATQHNGWIIENISFEDTSGSGAATGGVRIRRMNRVEFRHCAWRDFDGTNDYAVLLDGTGDFTAHTTFINPFIENCYDGIRGTLQSDTTLFGGEINATNVGTDTTGGDTRIFGTAYKIPDGGIGVRVGSTQSMVYAKFEGTGVGSPVPNTIGADVTATGIGCIVQGRANRIETVVSIDADAARNFIGPLDAVSATTVISGTGKQTTFITNHPGSVEQRFSIKTLNSGIVGQAGFETATEPDGVLIPTMLVSLNRGMLVKDDKAISGGLWLSADSPSRATVGAGAYGDLTTTLVATGTTASSILFWDGEIRFYTDESLTAGNTFTRTQRGSFSPTGAFLLGGDLDHNGSNVGFYGTTPAAQASASADLTGNAAGSTDGAIQTLTDPADTPGTADVLRDDLVANLIPELRNNIDELRLKLNDALAALRGIGITAT